MEFFINIKINWQAKYDFYIFLWLKIKIIFKNMYRLCKIKFLVSVIKLYWNDSLVIHLHIVWGSFYATMTELNQNYVINGDEEKYFLIATKSLKKNSVAHSTWIMAVFALQGFQHAKIFITTLSWNNFSHLTTRLRIQ